MISYDKLSTIAERYEDEITEFRLTGKLTVLVPFLEAVGRADQLILKDEFFNAMTNNEKIAFEAIREEIGGSGNLSIVKMIQKTEVSRPVWTSLLQKMEKYGVAIVKSQGVKGTYIEFKEEILVDGF